MEGEILSLETAKKLASVDKAIEYMNQHKELIAIMGTYYFKLLNILQGEE